MCTLSKLMHTSIYVLTNVFFNILKQIPYTIPMFFNFMISLENAKFHVGIYIYIIMAPSKDMPPVKKKR